MRKLKFTNGEIYHVYNRGIDKKQIFLNPQDHLRFIHDMFEFNDSNIAIPSNARFQVQKPSTANEEVLRKKFQNLEAELPNTNIKRKRKLLGEITVFCLMPNHFHLLIKQRQENGISRFMQKIGTGYTNYFNTKYERSGHLFQGKFKAEQMESEAHLLHLPYYIHLNPLDLAHPEWRNKEMENPKAAMKFLETYRWSSFQDYIGKKNFPSVTQREFIQKLVGNEEEYKKETCRWLKERKTDLWDVSKFE